MSLFQRRWQTLVALLVLAGATVATLWPVCGHPFVEWDDEVTLWQQPAFNPPTLQKTLAFWHRPVELLYIPATYTIWGALAEVAWRALPGGGSLDPRVFHTANLLVHVLATWAAFFLLRDIVGKTWPAVAGSLLFALHPVQVEPVAWASGMKDLLCGLFSILALRQYLRAARLSLPGAANEVPAPNRFRGAGAYVAATGWFLLAMLSKPAAVALPVSAAAIDLLVARRRAIVVARSIAPWVALSIPVMIIAKIVQPAYDVHIPALWQRPLVAADALAWDLGKIVAPMRSAVDYGRTPQWVLHRPQTYLIWIIPAALFGMAFGFWRRRPLITLAAVLFVAPLLPVLGLVPFSFQQFSTVADHYLYLSMLGPALLAATALCGDRRGLAWVGAAMVLAALAIVSFQQTLPWKDTTTLFTHNLQMNPRSLAANRVLGFLAARRGDVGAAERFYSAALAIDPDDPITHFDDGNLLMAQENDPAAALPHYAIAARGRSDDPTIHATYAEALRRTGHLAEADHEMAEAYTARAKLSLAQGDTAAAERDLRRAIERDPSLQELRQLLEEVRSHRSR